MAELELAALLDGRAIAIVSCFRYAETLSSDGLVYYPAQYARELAEHAPVLWVNPPARRPRPPRRVGRVIVVDTVGGQREIGHWRGAPLAQARLALAAFAAMNRHREVVLFHFSTMFPPRTRAAVSRRVAFVGDSFFPIDAPYLRECDLVVCSSQAHFEQVLATTGLPPPLQLSMGVSEAFLESARGAARTGVLRRLFDDPDRPLVASFGRLIRADIPLLSGLARALPEVNLLVAGTMGDIDPELDLPNVRLLARYRNEEMPGLLGDVDVGLVAYAVDAFNLGSSPTKLFEFFAAGLPVVSTPLAYPPVIGSLVRLAGTPDEAARAVTDALADPGDAGPRRAAAEASTPRKRLVALLRALEGSSVKG